MTGPLRADGTITSMQVTTISLEYLAVMLVKLQVVLLTLEQLMDAMGVQVRQEVLTSAVTHQSGENCGPLTTSCQPVKGASVTTQHLRWRLGLQCLYQCE